jgi:hypothetical protein
MSRRITVAFIVIAVVALGTVDVQAGAYARWYGRTIAATKATTFVPGATPPGCTDVKVYPFGPYITLPLISSCLSVRPLPLYGGSYAYARCDTTTTGIRRQWSGATSWGWMAFGGKAGADTVRCSTVVDIDAGSTSFDLAVYAELESYDPAKTSIVRLSATAEGDTLFYGGVRFTGNPDVVEAEGGFSGGDFVVAGGKAIMERSFTGIDMAGHPAESLQVQTDTDTFPMYPVPATTNYGMIALILILMAAGIFLFYRKRIRTDSAGA